MTSSARLSLALRLSFRTASFRGATLISAALVGLAFVTSGCATSTSSSPEPEAPAANPAEEEEVQIVEEAPEVTRCHTETQECDLTEPLPPGAGCFCAGKDGAQEAGTAGG
jgi:hypothetical protein